MNNDTTDATQNADHSQNCVACGDSTNSPQHIYCVPCADDIDAWHDSQPEPTDAELEDMAKHYEEKYANHDDFNIGYEHEANLIGGDSDLMGEW